MLADEAWGAIGIPVCPEDVQWRLKPGICPEHSSSFTLILINHVFQDLALCTGALLCWNRCGPLHRETLMLQHTKTIQQCGVWIHACIHVS